MDSVTIEYMFLWVVILLIFFAFLIWTQKMLQVIVATACISLLLLGRSGILEVASYLVREQHTLTLFWFWPENIAEFLYSAKIATSILIFWGLLTYVLQYSSPLLVSASWFFSSKFTQLLLSPFAIFSMIVTLSVAVLWIDIFSIEFLISTREQFWPLSLISLLVQYLPFALFAQGMLTLLLIFRKQKKSDHEMSYDDLVGQDSSFD